VAVTHQGLRYIEPVRLPIHAHHLATVTIGLDHVDEYIALADEADQSGPRSVAIRLIFFRRVDVLQAHVDIAPLRRAHQETIAIEDFANRAGEVTVIGMRRDSCPQQAGPNY
jgi:hypothetical protein